MAVNYSGHGRSSSKSSQCDLCLIAGRAVEADYIYVSEELSMEGPAMGDPDYWDSSDDVPKGVCEMHYRSMRPDRRLDYAPVDPFADPR